MKKSENEGTSRGYYPRMAESLERWFGDYGHICKRLMPPADPVGPEYLSDLAHTKRFLECYVADSEFRDALYCDAPRAIRDFAHHYDLQADPEEIRFLWDRNCAAEHRADEDFPLPDRVRRYRSFIMEKLTWRDYIREIDCVPINPAYRKWRERQLSRSVHESGDTHVRGNVHSGFCIELSKGCSVGCWFCGISAGKKEADCPYTPVNAKLWKGVLNVALEVIGPSARNGFCYWATDPLDNPDYEKFCTDFADVLGRFPQTTTAQPLKYVERMKALMKLSRSRGCTVDRFSVLSLGMFRKIMKEFTAEELLHTELLTQNMESNTVLTRAGRALSSDKIKQKAEKLNAVFDENETGTVACVSGFLFNMVEHSVRLVTPCRACPNWPDGYWVFEEGSFDTADDLHDLMLGMIERNMPTAIRYCDPIAFRSDVELSFEDEEVYLLSYHTKSRLKKRPFLVETAELINRGDLSAAGIAEAMENHGVAMEETFNTLNDFFREGYLNEDPRFFSRKIDE